MIYRVSKFDLGCDQVFLIFLQQDNVEVLIQYLAHYQHMDINPENIFLIKILLIPYYYQNSIHLLFFYLYKDES